MENPSVVFLGIMVAGYAAAAIILVAVPSVSRFMEHQQRCAALQRYQTATPLPSRMDPPENIEGDSEKCPWCDAKVVAADDGLCPACQRPI